MIRPNGAGPDWEKPVANRGCKMGGPDCLECRLDVCIEDRGNKAVYRARLAERNRQILHLHRLGVHPEAIAGQLGLAVTTVIKIANRLDKEITVA